MSIEKIPIPITIRGISDNKYNASEFTKVPIILEGVDTTRRARTAVISREFYIVDDLSAKVLISVDILKPKRIVINFSDNTIKLGSY